MDICQRCGAQLRLLVGRRDEGLWVDGAGGEVCDGAGGAAPHQPVLGAPSGSSWIGEVRLRAAGAWHLPRETKARVITIALLILAAYPLGGWVAGVTAAHGELWLNVALAVLGLALGIGAAVTDRRIEALLGWWQRFWARRRYGGHD